MAKKSTTTPFASVVELLTAIPDISFAEVRDRIAKLHPGYRLAPIAYGRAKKLLRDQGAAVSAEAPRRRSGRPAPRTPRKTAAKAVPDIPDGYDDVLESILDGLAVSIADAFRGIVSRIQEQERLETTERIRAALNGHH
jgi:hypothetical protein